MYDTTRRDTIAQECITNTGKQDILDALAYLSGYSPIDYHALIARINQQHEFLYPPKA